MHFLAFLQILGAGDSHCFLPDYFFIDVSLVNICIREYVSLEQKAIFLIALDGRDNVSIWNKAQACLFLIVRHVGPLNWSLLSYNAPHSICRCHLVLFMSPCENWGMGHWCKCDAHTACSCCVLGMRKSFVFDMGILCLLLAFLKWQQNKVLAYK